MLIALPFVLCIGFYLVFSDIRHDDNPNDKILPTIGQMVDAVDRLAFTEDRRTGEYLVWSDTLTSLQRLLLGAGIAAILGLNMGLFPAMRACLAPSSPSSP